MDITNAINLSVYLKKDEIERFKDLLLKISEFVSIECGNDSPHLVNETFLFFLAAFAFSNAQDKRFTKLTHLSAKHYLEYCRDICEENRQV